MSFRYAWEGIVSLFSNERNAQIHLGAAVCVITAGCLFDLSAVEWCLISLCIGGVFMAEGFNTAIEKCVTKCRRNATLWSRRQKMLPPVLFFFL